MDQEQSDEMRKAFESMTFAMRESIELLGQMTKLLGTMAAQVAEIHAAVRAGADNNENAEPHGSDAR